MSKIADLSPDQRAHVRTLALAGLAKLPPGGKGGGNEAERAMWEHVIEGLEPKKRATKKRARKKAAK